MGVGRVKAIFTLPQKIERPGHTISAPAQWPKDPLAYLELFRLSAQANKNHGMFTAVPEIDNQGIRLGAIVPITNIRQSCMLIPVFPTRNTPEAEQLHSWQPENVLDQADSFVLNNFLNMYSYQTIY